MEALPHPWGGVLVPPMAGVPYNQAGFLLVAWEVAWEVALEALEVMEALALDLDEISCIV